MIVIVTYIVNLIAPITNFLGALGVCLCFTNEDFHILIIAGVLAVIGLVFGIFAYKNDIPPRWFWAKSKNEIFSFSVSAVLGYAGIFAMLPCAIYMIQEFIDML